MLNEKTFPQNFTVNKEEYSFVVISPQLKKWPVPKDVSDIIEYSLKNYRVDSQRIYLVGMSMGGGVIWEYAGKYKKIIAAMVPICGASWADSAVASENCSQPYTHMGIS